MTSTLTNQSPSDTHRAAFGRLLSEMGVTETHGLELLRLIKMCNGAYDTILGEQMRHESMSSPQWRLLSRLLIAERGGEESLTPTELARSQRLSKNTVSAHLRHLEEHRLIERKIDPDDLRAFRIQLSEEGRRLMYESLPIHIRFLNRLANGLTAEEIGQAEILLEKLHGSLLQWAEDNDKTKSE
jgi:DNA-binding MarR family transcriptional regulator